MGQAPLAAIQSLTFPSLPKSNPFFKAVPFPEKQIFDRTARLVGPDALGRLSNTRVIIFGVGGVGSWAAETLVRTGLGHLTIVDADRVAMSNINRQLPALTSTVGMVKTEVMRSRLLDINPNAEIVALHKLYNKETAEDFDLASYDYVIDAIDSLADKALLILNATRAVSGGNMKFYSSMGAALKIDPSRISVAEFWKVKGCPLAAALRRRFKKSDVYPSRKFKCVYSDEPLPNHPDYKSAEVSDDECDSPMTFNKVATNGSLMHITAIFGITLASLVIRDVTAK